MRLNLRSETSPITLTFALALTAAVVAQVPLTTMAVAESNTITTNGTTLKPVNGWGNSDRLAANPTFRERLFGVKPALNAVDRREASAPLTSDKPANPVIAASAVIVVPDAENSAQDTLLSTRLQNNVSEPTTGAATSEVGSVAEAELRAARDALKSLAPNATDLNTLIQDRRRVLADRNALISDLADLEAEIATQPEDLDVASALHEELALREAEYEAVETEYADIVANIERVVAWLEAEARVVQAETVIEDPTAVAEAEAATVRVNQILDHQASVLIPVEPTE